MRNQLRGQGLKISATFFGKKYSRIVTDSSSSQGVEPRTQDRKVLGVNADRLLQTKNENANQNGEGLDTIPGEGCVERLTWMNQRE